MLSADISTQELILLFSHLYRLIYRFKTFIINSSHKAYGSLGIEQDNNKLIRNINKFNSQHKKGIQL